MQASKHHEYNEEQERLERTHKAMVGLVEKHPQRFIGGIND